MFTCPNCGKELEDGTKFCVACGKRVYEPIFCPYCGEKTTTEFEVCPKCGAIFTEIDEDTATPNESMVAVENRVAARKAPKLVVPKAVKAPENAAAKALPKKGILIAGIIVAVLAVIAIIGFIIFGLLGGRGSDYYGLYIKDNEIYYTDYSGKDTIQVTSRLLNGDEFNFADADDADDAAEAIGDVIAFSDDGKRIFYPDRAEMGENIKTSEISLYYRDINKPEKEAVKVDSGIKNYAINSAGSQVVYLKNDNLYVYDIKKGEKEKIASDVHTFNVADDCKKIGYFNIDGGYYLWRAGEGSEKWVNDIEIYDLKYASDDLSTIYYLIDDTLYKRTEESGKSDKIAADVYDVSQVYDSGEIYYVRTNEIPLIDYVDDDLAASDAAITEPTYPSNPTWTNILAYNSAYNAYRNKTKRDDLREQLKNSTSMLRTFSLYYYNGTEETLVTDEARSFVLNTSAQSAEPRIWFYLRTPQEKSKIKMSEVSSKSDVFNFTMSLADVNAIRKAYVAVDSTIYEIGDNACYIWFPWYPETNPDTVYYIDNAYKLEDGWVYGNLYKTSISDGQIGEPELIDDDVSRLPAFYFQGESFIYYKDGCYHVGGEATDYDIQRRIVSISDDDAILYYMDWDDDKKYGTLTIGEDGTKTKVADDVHSCIVTSKDDILYLYDYSTRSFNGTLYLYNNGKPKKIDSDVAAIIPTDSSTSNTLRGKNYDDYKWYW